MRMAATMTISTTVLFTSATVLVLLIMIAVNIVVQISQGAATQNLSNQYDDDDDDYTVEYCCPNMARAGDSKLKQPVPTETPSWPPQLCRKYTQNINPIDTNISFKCKLEPT